MWEIHPNQNNVSCCVVIMCLILPDNGPASALTGRHYRGLAFPILFLLPLSSPPSLLLSPLRANCYYNWLHLFSGDLSVHNNWCTDRAPPHRPILAPCGLRDFRVWTLARPRPSASASPQVEPPIAVCALMPWCVLRVIPSGRLVDIIGQCHVGARRPVVSNSYLVTLHQSPIGYAHPRRR